MGVVAGVLAEWGRRVLEEGVEGLLVGGGESGEEG